VVRRSAATAAVTRPSGVGAVTCPGQHDINPDAYLIIWSCAVSANSQTVTVVLKQPTGSSPGDPGSLQAYAVNQS
jgi:hypothetical protein